MHILLSLAIESYARLLRLYPSSYRQEFEGQMLLDFSDLATDAAKRGNYVLIIFFMRELLDFPISLLQAHWKEGSMIRIFRSPPVAMGARSAVGFSLGFAVIVIATWQISHWLFLTFDPWIQDWSVWYYDTFGSEEGSFLIQRFLMLISTILTGSIFGLVFGLLFGGPSKYLRHMLVGTLGFLVPNGVFFVLWEVFGWSLDLSPNQNYVLNISTSILVGTFWGAICALLDNSHTALLRLLTAGTILYPLSTYIFMKLLFVFRLESTPWLFVSLMALMLVLIGSVFVVVSRNVRKIPWMVLAAAVGYPSLYFGIIYLAYNILHLPSPEPGVGISPEVFVVYQLNYMVVEACIGAVFGLLLGLIWGYQRRYDSRPAMA